MNSGMLYSRIFARNVDNLMLELSGGDESPPLDYAISVNCIEVTNELPKGRSFSRIGDFMLDLDHGSLTGCSVLVDVILFIGDYELPITDTFVADEISSDADFFVDWFIGKLSQALVETFPSMEKKYSRVRQLKGVRNEWIQSHTCSAIGFGRDVFCKPADRVDESTIAHVVKSADRAGTSSHSSEDSVESPSDEEGDFFIYSVDNQRFTEYRLPSLPVYSSADAFISPFYFQEDDFFQTYINDGPLLSCPLAADSGSFSYARPDRSVATVTEESDDSAQSVGYHDMPLNLRFECPEADNKYLNLIFDIFGIPDDEDDEDDEVSFRNNFLSSVDTVCPSAVAVPVRAPVKNQRNIAESVKSNCITVKVPEIMPMSYLPDSFPELHFTPYSPSLEQQIVDEVQKKVSYEMNCEPYVSPSVRFRRAAAHLLDLPDDVFASRAEISKEEFYATPEDEIIYYSCNAANKYFYLVETFAYDDPASRVTIVLPDFLARVRNERLAAAIDNLEKTFNLPLTDYGKYIALRDTDVPKVSNADEDLIFDLIEDTRVITVSNCTSAEKYYNCAKLICSLPDYLFAERFFLSKADFLKIWDQSDFFREHGYESSFHFLAANFFSGHKLKSLRDQNAVIFPDINKKYDWITEDYRDYIFYSEVSTPEDTQHLLKSYRTAALRPSKIVFSSKDGKWYPESVCSTDVTGEQFFRCDKDGTWYSSDTQAIIHRTAFYFFRGDRQKVYDHLQKFSHVLPFTDLVHVDKDSFIAYVNHIYEKDIRSILKSWAFSTAIRDAPHQVLEAYNSYIYYCLSGKKTPVLFSSLLKDQNKLLPPPDYFAITTQDGKTVFGFKPLPDKVSENIHVDAQSWAIFNSAAHFLSQKPILTYSDCVRFAPVLSAMRMWPKLCLEKKHYRALADISAILVYESPDRTVDIDLEHSHIYLCMLGYSSMPFIDFDDFYQACKWGEVLSAHQVVGIDPDFAKFINRFMSLYDRLKMLASDLKPIDHIIRYASMINTPSYYRSQYTFDDIETPSYLEDSSNAEYSDTLSDKELSKVEYIKSVCGMHNVNPDLYVAIARNTCQSLLLDFSQQVASYVLEDYFFKTHTLSRNIYDARVRLEGADAPKFTTNDYWSMVGEVFIDTMRFFCKQDIADKLRQVFNSGTSGPKKIIPITVLFSQYYLRDALGPEYIHESRKKGMHQVKIVLTAFEEFFKAMRKRFDLHVIGRSSKNVRTSLRDAHDEYMNNLVYRLVTAIDCSIPCLSDIASFSGHVHNRCSTLELKLHPNLGYGDFLRPILKDIWNNEVLPKPVSSMGKPFKFDFLGETDFEKVMELIDSVVYQLYPYVAEMINSSFDKVSTQMFGASYYWVFCMNDFERDLHQRDSALDDSEEEEENFVSVLSSRLRSTIMLTYMQACYYGNFSFTPAMNAVSKNRRDMLRMAYALANFYSSSQPFAHSEDEFAYSSVVFSNLDGLKPGDLVLTGGHYLSLSPTVYCNSKPMLSFVDLHRNVLSYLFREFSDFLEDSVGSMDHDVNELIKTGV